MKIETPSIRRIGNRAFFHGACSVLCALVITVIMLERSTDHGATIPVRLPSSACCCWSWPQVPPIVASLGGDGVWRIHDEGFDRFVTPEEVIATLHERLRVLDYGGNARVVVTGDELANWGEVFEVWVRLAEERKVRVPLGLLPNH